MTKRNLIGLNMHMTCDMARLRWYWYWYVVWSRERASGFYLYLGSVAELLRKFRNCWGFTVQVGGSNRRYVRTLARYYVAD